MKNNYSVEVDKDNPTALAHCLRRLEFGIPDFEYDWKLVINAGGIDYGIYLNVDLNRKEIEICNQPNGNGDDFLDDILECFEEEEEEEDD